MKIKTDWKTYYPVHCKVCKWTGSSEFVLGDPLSDGPFFCPYCMNYKYDPTEYDVSGPQYDLENFIKDYIPKRIFSLLTQPLRFFIKKYTQRQLDKWIKRSEEMEKEE